MHGGGLELGGVVAGDPYDLDPVPLGQVPQYGMGPAVQAALGHHPVAGPQQGEQDAADRPHAGGEGDGPGAALQAGEGPLQGPYGRIAASAVDVPPVGSGHGRGELGGGLEGEGGGLHQGHGERPTAAREWFVDDMDSTGVQFHGFPFPVRKRGRPTSW